MWVTFSILGEVAAEWLEPDDGKLSRPVLRGEGSRKAPDLPDLSLLETQVTLEHGISIGA